MFHACVDMAPTRWITSEGHNALPLYTIKNVTLFFVSLTSAGATRCRGGIARRVEIGREANAARRNNLTNLHFSVVRQSESESRFTMKIVIAIKRVVTRTTPRTPRHLSTLLSALGLTLG